MEIKNSLNAYLSGITVCRWAALGALILMSKLWQWHFPLVASCRHLELSCMGQSPSAGQWAILHPGLIQPHLPLLYCWADFSTLNTLHIVSSGAASPISPLLWHTSLQTVCHTHLKSCSFQKSDKIFCVERGRLALCLSSILSASASQFTNITWQPHSNISPLSCAGKVCPTFSHLVTGSQKREVTELTWK